MEDSDRLSTFREQLAQCLGQQRYELWLGPQTSLRLENSALQIGCPTQFHLQGLRRRLHDALLKSCRQLLGESWQVRYIVDTTLQTAQEPPCDTEGLRNPRTEENKADDVGLRVAQEVGQPSEAPVAKPRAPQRRSRGTFASLVVGKGNELASRTARAVAQQPGRYCPLLLHGPPGVGKTHLLQAIREEMRRHAPRRRVVHLTAEQFTAQFLEALDRRTLPSFRQKYRTIDVLLIDDLQFLIGKRATLDELIHTIDTLQERGQQVVLSCDRCLGQLQEISPDLVSRLSGGLAVPIDPPDYSTRVGIVRNLAGRLHIQLEEEVAAIIASQVAGSARQLSGALNRLVASSQAWDKPITVEFTRQTLVDFVQQSTPAVKLDDIQRAICQVFHVEPSSLKSERKTRSIAEPRMLAMCLARKYTRSALSEISDYFGRRSHSTVISAQRKVESLVSQGAEISVADRPCRVEEAIRQVEDLLRRA